MRRREASFWEAAAAGDDRSSVEVIDDGMRLIKSGGHAECPRGQLQLQLMAAPGRPPLKLSLTSMHSCNIQQAS